VAIQNQIDQTIDRSGAVSPLSPAQTFRAH
jgi:hypothetical protein